MKISLVPLLFQGLLSVIFLPGIFRLPQQNEEAITINLARPGEGETFYAGPSSLLYNIPIHGWVESELYPFEEIKVLLAIYQNSELVSSQEIYLDTDGTYEFYATVNPDGSSENFPATQADCSSYCHYLSELVLPAGDMTIELTAIDPAGNRDSLERHITVDRSDYAYIPLQVVLVDSDSSDHTLENIPVTAFTRLYMWRSRHSVASTNENGRVDVRVEALAESPTHYWLQVEPSIVNGVLYYSEKPVEVLLPPGATTSAPLVLDIRTKTGSIRGKVMGVDEALIPTARVLAIRTSDGFFYSTDVSPQGDFVFDPIPLQEYLIIPDWGGQIHRQEFTPEAKKVDLMENPVASIEFVKAEADGHGIHGAVHGDDDRALPFAWIVSDELPLSQRVVANSGEFEIQGLPEKAITFIVNAPGYYSRAYRLDSSPDQWQSLLPVLKRRPETISIPWGTGEIVVPPESSVETDGSQIKFERGWLWGSNPQESEIVIRHELADIVLAQGRFAFESLPNQNNWLYLMEGSATIYPKNGMPSVTVNAGEMVTLAKNTLPVPIPMDRAVISAFYSDTDESVQPVWEPTLSARIRDSFAKVGVNGAQVITFITYGLILISIVGFPFLALYSRLRWQNQNIKEDYDETKR